MNNTERARRKLGLLATVCIATLLTATAAGAQTAPSLGAAQPFAVLGATAVTNTGPSVINGDLGISPNGAGSVTGFPPGLVNGTVHAADGVALNAQNAMTTAYNALFAQACNTTFPVPTNVGGTTRTAGVYCFTSSAQITGDLTLDAQGNPNAVFIFKTGTGGASTLTTAPGSRVLLVNGAQPCNVFWAVSSSATIDTTSTFVGNLLAQVSITVNNGAHLFGRAFAKAAVTLDNNVVDATVCTGLAAACVASQSPTITAIPSQVIPVVQAGGSVAVGFTIGGGTITDALVVSSASSNTTLVPQSAMTITKGAGGARVLTIVGADGRSGVTNITVSVTDPSAGCTTSVTFQLTVGAVAVPTLSEWALLMLAILLTGGGALAIRRRTAVGPDTARTIR